MIDTIERLLILQDRDRQIVRLREELAQVEPQRQDLTAKAVGAQAILEKARTRGMQIETERKSLDLEIEQKKELIVKYANQQFQTRKNEEYRALAHEIEGCKKAIFEIEDRQIVLMEQAEEAQKGLARATQASADARKLAEGEIAQLGTRETALTTELERLEANREERLFKHKGGNVVVGVNHGVCGGCHMRLPTQLVVLSQARNEMVSCINCGRILYYTPDMDVALVD
jgi:predicted  nucleic acid-binding Zn-ribbon protein